MHLVYYEDAVKTVLIRRFGKLWTFVSRLPFDQCSYHDCADIVYSDGVEYDERFLDFVHNVLILHENPTIDQFILKLDYNLWRTSDEGPNDYGCGELEPGAYILPDVVMNCQYLTQMKLVACEIIPTGQIKLNSLKKLFLEEIDLKGEILNQILCGSSVLEELSLVKCYSLHTLAFKNPSIKRLIVEFEPMSSSERRVFQKLSRSKLVRLCTWSIMVRVFFILYEFPLIMVGFYYMAAKQSARSILSLEVPGFQCSSVKMAPYGDFLLAEQFSIFGDTYHIHWPWFRAAFSAGVEKF
ncbi:F-box protein [Corchorus olitorius]|uniref:F-box protein n=1 Tax=Corchorus olitorius TaxID=93759 RepID=A0A1R3GRX8_9ROSI|nr:F-box protein [Corchorus olitorius]